MPVRSQRTQLDAMVITHLFTALQMRQQQAPTPQRAEALDKLRPIYDRFAHGQPIRPEDLDAAGELGTYLELLEDSSLGTSTAKAVRGSTSARDVADVLVRTVRKMDEHLTRRTSQHLSDAAVAAYVACELSPDAQEAAGQHLAGCSQCKGAVEQHLELDAHSTPLTATERVRTDLVGITEPVDAAPVDLTKVEPGEIDALVSAAVAGDRDAIERLMAAMNPLMIRYCRARLGSQRGSFHRADDVAQEVCITLLTALPRYRDQARSFLAFAYGIASHKVAQAHRTRSATKDVASQLTSKGMVNRFSALLGLLPVRQREIVVLRLVVGLSAEETAQALDLTPAEVRTAQHRALAHLRHTIDIDDV